MYPTLAILTRRSPVVVRDIARGGALCMSPVRSTMPVRFSSTATDKLDLITYNHPTAPLAAFNRRLSNNLRLVGNPKRCLRITLEIVQEIKAQGLKFDLHTYNALLAAYTRARHSREALSVLKEMRQEGINPTKDSYNAVLTALGSQGHIQPQAQVVEYMKENQIELTASTYLQLLKGMCENDQLENALDMLDSIKKQGVQPNLPSYGTIIGCSLRLNHPEVAFQMMKEAEDSNLPVETDHHIYMDVLRAVAFADEHEYVEYCWEKVNAHSMRPDEGSCLQVLRVAAQSGNAKLATDVIRQLSTSGFPLKENHFSPLMEAFLVKDNLKSAFNVLDIMRASGVTPTLRATLPIQRKLFDKLEAIDEAYFLLVEMKKDGKTVDPSAFNVVVMACAEAKDLNRTVATYREAQNLGVTPDIETYNAVIEACVQTKMKGMGNIVIDEMKKANVTPNMETYSRMIALACTQMNYEDAFTYLEEMKGYGVVPPASCYQNLVRKLAYENDPRFHIALEEMETFGYSTHNVRQLWK